MSEPPLKKKKTILDFFTSKVYPKRNRKEAGGEMASSNGNSATSSSVSKNSGIEDASEPQASTSGVKNKNAVPKLTKDLSAGAISDTIEIIEESDLDEGADSQGSDLTSSQKIPDRKPSQRRDGSNAWKGIPLNTLTKLTDSKLDFGPLYNSEHHRVLFKTPFVYDGKKPPTPFPSYKDKWDTNYVRMPCSNQSEYPVVMKEGQKVRRRWDMIQEALLQDIPGPFELEEKILEYNSRYFGKWNFTVLHELFITELAEEERLHFFKSTLKKMAALALQLPHLCSAPIPLLKKGQTKSITLSQQQIACLLANAFFCTYPRRNSKSRNAEFSNYPTINFNSMYTGHPTQVRLEKLKCLIHYFSRIFDEMPKGTVTFTRQSIDHLPSWDHDDTKLTGLHVSSEGTIEDDGLGLLQVDFANKFLGGGVLGHGCVQEEIRFLICPEMMVTRLFTEVLEKNECLIMRGCERFSNYDGYAAKFVWKENYVDNTPRDSWGRICCEVVAIDALVIHDYKTQFQQYMVKRELNKAYVGFYHHSKKPQPAVCTGNWGCGAFGGDKRLKALIQLMAAAHARRDVCYYTFDDEKLRDDLHKIHSFLTGSSILGVGDLMKLIEQYRRKHVLKSISKKPKINLFEYIAGVFSGKFEDTDDDSSNQSNEMKQWSEGPDVTKEDENWLELGSDEIMDEVNLGLKKEDSFDYKANTP